MYIIAFHSRTKVSYRTKAIINPAFNAYYCFSFSNIGNRQEKSNNQPCTQCKLLLFIPEAFLAKLKKQ